jgi:hypothetical protein
MGNLPECIHHYTNFEGLKGILTEDCLWATDAYTSNDLSEIDHGARMLQDHLKQRFPNDPSNIDGFINKFLGKNPEWVKGFFITCFSKAEKNSYEEKNGLLSQWRGYGSGQGYMIKFNTDELLNGFENHNEEIEASTFGGVEYFLTKEDFLTNEENAKSIKKAEDVLGIMLKNLNNSDGSDNKNMLFQEILKISCHSKHRGFEEEKEFRAGRLIWNHNKERKIFFYNKNGLLRSYIKLFQGHVKSSIKEIVVGPSLNKDLNKKKIKIMLDQIGVNAKVSTSETPYV